MRSAVLWGYIFGASVASSAFSYDRIYATAAERHRLAETFGANHAAAALFGPAPELQTVAGFTVFKVSITLMIVGAVWGLLTSTRLLRGDEDAGRWEILVTAPTTRARATAQAIAGTGAGAAVIWAVTAALTIAVGRLSAVHFDVPASLYFALALVATAVMFLAVGALTSQLAGSRRQAAVYASAALGVSYGLRMVADAGAGLHWLIWASPLGWVEQLQPLTAPRPWALLPIAAFTAVSVFLAVYLAGRRDIGAGVWPVRTSRKAHLRLLSGPTGLTLRLTRPSVLWWATAAATTGLLTGVVAKAAGSTIVGSSVQQVLSRLGAPGTGTRAYLGVAFLIIAIVIGFQSVTLVGAARAEEADGRLDHLLSGTISRGRWLGGRVFVATSALLLSGFSAGLFTYLGTLAQGAGVGISTALDAGTNVIPPAIFLLGTGVLALGKWPRQAVAAPYVALGWSALIELVGGFFAQDHWVLDTSLFHQLAYAPAVAPNWAVNGVLLGLGAAEMLTGALAFSRRDVIYQ